MVVLASLTFSGRNWLPPAAVVLLAAVFILYWSYRAAPAGWVRWVCLSLKLLGLAALAFCLLEPLWSGQRARPGANVFAILADNSQSMQIRDTGQPQTRGEILLNLLSPALGGWQRQIDTDFELRRYYFDARLQNTRDFGELKFDGRASSLVSAVRSLADRYKGRPLAGIILLTDGNATDSRGPIPDLSGLPPIYPVAIGQKGGIKDISLEQVSVSQSAFEDAPVAIQAEVSATGFRGEKIAAKLTDQSGKTITEKKLRASGDGSVAALQIQLKPEKPRLSFYKLRVGPEAELAQTGEPTNSAEATLANNSRVLVVDRGHGPYRILYVSGRPNWEFKFLNRAVQADDQIQLVGLIRVAKREPKFAFRGRAGETDNPLFRGFNDKRDTAERYDQPVLTRLNTRDNEELRGGFPRTAEELYSYHAIIVDDLEAEFFTTETASLVQKFVSERGGGFLMLGGMETFQQGLYHRTPIGEMLPVYLDSSEGTRPGGALRLNLAREGWLQPWVRIRDNENDERTRLQGMPVFEVFNKVREVKPGASIIASATDENGKEFPALITQRFGRGRTAALTVGNIWRWGMENPDARADMEKSWRQFMRWLVSDVPNRVDLAAEPQPADPNGAVKLQARIRDAKFQPLDNASVSVLVEPVIFGGSPSTNTLRLIAEPSLDEPGLYETTYVPRLTSGYKATVFATNSAGAEVGRAEAGWNTDFAAEEFRSLTPNLSLLEEIAKKTGGEVVPAAKLDDFARGLPTRRAPEMEAWSRPIWHTPAMFAFALASLLAEWGLRRWKGMP
jgi:uncharacterized membrane protein